MLFTVIAFSITLICVLITVPFYTLYERKLLSLSHIRLGPNIVGVLGLLQPFSDAIKLFSKSILLPHKSNWGSYVLCPILTMSVSLVAWSLTPWFSGLLSACLLLLVLFITMALSGMLHLGVGWCSNSSYSVVGALRCLAQSISYEVSLAIILLCMMIPVMSVDLYRMSYFYPLGLFILPITLTWLLSCLAESNRSPYDFAEAESELVSGFNVEYGGALFAFLFIAEYASMVFLSTLSGHVLIGGGLFSIVAAIMFMHLFVWVRATLPRTRYDKLMSLCWTILLPSVLLGMGVTISLFWVFEV